VKLTSRQTEVISLVARGYKNHEIGTTMGIGGKTVSNYLKVIFDKTGMNSRLELTLWHLYHQTRGLAETTCQECVAFEFCKWANPSITRERLRWLT